MSLAPGVRLGAYEVFALIGAGGMGEVYKARDTRLNRTVAIKVLPAHVATDPDRRQRFDREARAVAALNHPHICTLHDIGHQDGTDFLVMEYLEGETLAEKLGPGSRLTSHGSRLPLDEALTIAIQIADALDKAHRHGITHRDLKPGNIMLTKAGAARQGSPQAKLLDFGLAKTAGVAQNIGPAVAGGFKDLRLADTITMLPTWNSPLTAQGKILGTFQYMAPEQLEGKEADARTDIFAFGAVLYEMLTGRKAFEGKSQASLIAAIMSSDPPPISQMQPLTPPLLDHIVKRCFAKYPDDRWQAASDVMRELTWIAEAPAATSTMTAPPMSLWRRVAVPASAWLLGVVMAGTVVRLATPPTVPPSRVSRLQITPPSAAALTFNDQSRDLAITPDGTRVVYRGTNGSTLLVRALDQLDATALTGLHAAADPFVSPDGQWIGFADGSSGALKKVAITGGPEVTLARGEGAATFRGATWAPDDTIIFATTNPVTGLQRILAGRGEPTVLTRPNHQRGEADHLWPEVLPGGQAVLFTITATTGGLDQAQIAVLDLRTGTQTTLVRGGIDAHYVPSGASGAATAARPPGAYLVYGAAGALRAVGFDVARLAVVGTSVPVVPQVLTTDSGAVHVAVAGNGTLVYVPGGVALSQRTMVWVDRQGQEIPISAPPRGYMMPRISPDGERVAVHASDQEQDIWLWDLVRSRLTRLTSEPGFDTSPAWTPDSRRLVFASGRAGARNLFTQAADGTGAVTRLTESANPQGGAFVSADGTRLLFRDTDPETGDDLMQRRLDGAHPVTPLVKTPFMERNGEISPDGHWLAYEANDAGPFEIYVRPFPDVAGGRWQVSTGGGVQPLWARSGQELFYLGPSGALMRVGVTRGATWAVTASEQLLKEPYYTGGAQSSGRSYDIAADGQRFLMIKQSPPAQSSLVVVQHFDEELKRLAPTK